MPDMARIAERIRPRHAANVLAPSQRDMRTGFLIFQNVAPHARLRITSKPKLGDVPSGGISKEEIAQLPRRHHVAEHFFYAVSIHPQSDDLVLVWKRQDATR